MVFQHFVQELGWQTYVSMPFTVKFSCGGSLNISERLSVHTVLAEGTKTRLVLHREIQESLILDCYTSLLASL